MNAKMMPRLTVAALSLLAATRVVAAEPEAGTVAGGAGATDSAGGGVADADILVTGERVRTEATGGTKTDTPLIETPQSISVVSSGDIAALGLQNLNQALRFVAGVTPEQRGASAEVYDQFSLRGFDAPIFLDGLRLFNSATGYAVPQVDVSRLDRIEIIKGPASALYGQSGPGGLVVEQSRLPIDRASYGSAAGTYGTFDLYRFDADIGGQVSRNALWRLYGSVNGAHSQQQFGYRRRYTISGGGTLGTSGPTTLTLLAAYSHDPRNGDYGVFPAKGTLIPNPRGDISQNFYGGEPNDFFRREQAAATYIARHDFGGGWAFRASGRYQYVGSRLGITYTGGFPADAFTTNAPDPAIFSRYDYSTREQTNSWTFDNQLSGAVRTGGLEHELLFGLDRQVSHNAETYAFGIATDIDVYDPVYGTIATPRQPEQVQTPFPGSPGYLNTRLRQQGVYGQDQISLAGLRLTVSGRYDWARGKSLTAEQHDSKFTYRVGALYLFDFGLAPYASYSTSFQQQAGQVSDDGGATVRNADPTLGRQIEAGVKYKIPDTEILLTGAWFRIQQTNVLTSVPPAGLFSIETGKVRSTGVEAEATAPLPHGFNAKVAFSRQRVRRRGETVDGIAIPGSGLATVGRGGVSANLEWAPQLGPLAGFAIGGAVRHVDSTYAGLYVVDGIEYRTHPYTLFDALLRYDLGRISERLSNVQVSANAKNIFNKKYLTSCYSAYGWCWYGDRRTVQGTIAFKW